MTAGISSREKTYLQDFVHFFEVFFMREVDKDSESFKSSF